MARWADLEAAEPEFAARVHERIAAHRHLTMATLRRDGAPRISGTEIELLEGDLWLGSMPGSRKGADLKRDPRIAIHSGSDEPDAWKGDAKLSGRAVETHDSDIKRVMISRHEQDPGPFDLFRIEIDEATVTGLNDAGNALVIEHWRPGKPLRRIERR